MNRSLLPAATLSLSLALIGAARSDQIPNLHVDQLCHGIASQQADPMADNYPAVSFQRCMDAEREDRDQLQKQWAGFSSDEKQHCIAEATAGGSASYTELLTCLEMAHVVKELRRSAPNNDRQYFQIMIEGDDVVPEHEAMAFDIVRYVVHHHRGIDGRTCARDD